MRFWRVNGNISLASTVQLPVKYQKSRRGRSGKRAGNWIRRKTPTDRNGRMTNRAKQSMVDGQTIVKFDVQQRPARVRPRERTKVLAQINSLIVKHIQFIFFAPNEFRSDGCVIISLKIVAMFRWNGNCGVWFHFVSFRISVVHSISFLGAVV